LGIGLLRLCPCERCPWVWQSNIGKNIAAAHLEIRYRLRRSYHSNVRDRLPGIGIDVGATPGGSVGTAVGVMTFGVETGSGVDVGYGVGLASRTTGSAPSGEGVGNGRTVGLGTVTDGMIASDGRTVEEFGSQSTATISPNPRPISAASVTAVVSRIHAASMCC
jgi:hypothetical protein